MSRPSMQERAAALIRAEESAATAEARYAIIIGPIVFAILFGVSVLTMRYFEEKQQLAKAEKAMADNGKPTGKTEQVVIK